MRCCCVVGLVGVVLAGLAARADASLEACQRALTITDNYVHYANFSSHQNMIRVSLLEFSNWDLGNFDKCQRLEGAHYCLADWLVETVGVCLPEECGLHELADPAIFDTLVPVGNGLISAAATSCSKSVDLYCFGVLNALGYFATVNATATVLQISSPGIFTCGDNIEDMDTGSIAMVVVCCVFAAVVLVGWASGQSWQELRALTPNRLPRKGSRPESTPPDVLRPLLQDHRPQQHVPTPSQHRGGMVRRFVGWFDPDANLRSLFTVRDVPPFAILSGVRTISMFWVIFGHTFLWQSQLGFTNNEEVYPPDGFLATWSGQVVVSAEFSVDTFFFMSGLLVTHSVATKLQKMGTELVKQPHKWVPMLYAHRFVRLSPAYFFMLFFQWKVVPLMGYWWTNLLYINNLHPWESGTAKECFGHAWYLANDFQFYVLSPLLIAPFVLNRKKGLALAVVVTLASLAWTVAITETDHLSAFALDGDDSSAYGNKFYVVPYLRIAPFLIGMVTAMLWQQKTQTRPDFKLSRGVAVLANVLAFVSLGLACYGCVTAYQQDPCAAGVSEHCGSFGKWNHAMRTLYTAWSKSLWSFGLALMCLLSLNKQLLPVVDNILGMKGFVPLARLTYCAYLVHPAVLSLVTYTSTTKYRFGNFAFANEFAGVTTLSYAAATVLSVVVEKPFMNIEKAVFTPRRLKEAPASNEHSA